ncbi:MAG: helix-turn-helix transcriptional regulator, partial [Oscillospiraceae bacterium]|nr:helix-turn-helix transcriptional regulator [Oscillospiraceae bacterium]
MDQIKTGAFLKNLRRERGITQEQLAEELGVSGRTISRWETGSNMPDISLLVEIAGFFDVSIPEIIKGERKSENMQEEVKEVAETMSDYAKAEKEELIKSCISLCRRKHVEKLSLTLSDLLHYRTY